jgi:hypothetical protein
MKDNGPGQALTTSRAASQLRSDENLTRNPQKQSKTSEGNLKRSALTEQALTSKKSSKTTGLPSQSKFVQKNLINTGHTNRMDAGLLSDQTTSR